ncbi:hypothetical protein TWF694_008696 [Orbilia ellipsospora]|uniref:Uncharacterized protein n=1 Tax=Orbilia ellipsospora TaxID=2528407 RepID=A0AAV9XJ53_9PEZI
MNSLKSIAKGGWHPEKKSNSSSSTSSSGNERFKNFKGLQQVANWTGHGTKGGPQEDPSTVTTRPLTSLKDPYSFGAPPKRDPKAPLPPPTQPNILTGRAPSPPPAEPETQEEDPRPRGFQINSTGLSTAGLPAPPKRTLGTTSTPSPPASSRPTPPLPNRSQPPPLPSRQASNPVGRQEIQSPFPNANTHNVTPSTAAASARLARAGISVPGLGIGSETPAVPSGGRPAPPPRGASQESKEHPPPAYSINELSNRFSSLKSTSGSISKNETPEIGTTWAQKQSALRTASQFRKDPTSVSVSDAAVAAKTAENFRQRHGDQVAKGYQRAQAAGLVDQVAGASSTDSQPQTTPSRPKWGDIASRASGASSSQGANPSASATSTGDIAGGVALASIAAKKRPPPPPKPRDLELAASPPPIPLGTKPR